MMKNLIGLDIGSSSVKLVRLKKVKGKIELERARVIELKDIKSIREGIERLLKSEKITSCQVCLSISGQSVFTRFVKLPKLSQKKVEQVVKYEAQQQIPFSIEKVIWDYQLYRRSESSEVEVYLAAVKRDIIDSLLKELAPLKIDVVSIQPSPIALYNFTVFNQDIKENSIILDIGAKTTDVIIAKGRRLWIRSIPIAGEELTEALSQKLGIKPDEAEKLKRKEAITLVGSTGDENLTPRSDVISKAIDPVLSDIATQVTRSINYYKKEFDKSAAFVNVLLTGGTSKVKYIERFFKNNLKMEVKRLNILKRMKPNRFLKVNLDEIEGGLVAALGAGLSVITTPAIDINLLPKEEKEIKKFSARKFYIFASEVMMILFFLILSYFYTQNISDVKNNLALLESKTKQYQQKQSIIKNIQSDIDNYKARLELLCQIKESKRFWLDVLAQINSTIPEDVWLISLQLDPEKENALIIEGKTTGFFDTVKNLRESLKKLECFSDAKTLRADLAGKGEGITTTQREDENQELDYKVIFTMRLQLKKKIPEIIKQDLKEKKITKR